MEGSTATAPVQDKEGRAPQHGRDWLLLALLLALAAGLRAAVIENTEVISRDGLVFIDYALQLESRPWQTVLLANHQHPGYPVCILAASLPIRHFMGRTDCNTMQLSAQLVSGLCGVLLVVPMFVLGRILFSRGVSFWATLLFQCLPVSGRILSDGLSESLFLLLTTTGLLMAVRGIQSGSAWRFSICGLCAGLAYLTRPEGVVLVAATGAFLLFTQAVASWRRGWVWTVASSTCLAMAALAAASPYFLATGQFTNKPSGKDVVRTARSDGWKEGAPQLGWTPASRTTGRASGVSVSRVALAVWLNKDLSLPRRLGNGIVAVLGEVLRGFHYVAWAPALLGLWWDRRRLQARQEAWLIAFLIVLYSLVLWRLAMVAGYVSERHVVVLVMCGLFPAVTGLGELPHRLFTSTIRAWRSFPFVVRSAPAWSLVLILAIAGTGLCKTLQPLHGNRAGHHAAGLWLADHTLPYDEICDSHFGWAKYYSGRFSPAKPDGPPPDERATRYVVKGSSLERVNPYGPANAVADMTEAEIKAAGGKIVFHWPERAPIDKAKVVVWAVSLPLNKAR